MRLSIPASRESSAPPTGPGIREAEEWEMRDLEAKHPSLKRGEGSAPPPGQGIREAEEHPSLNRGGEFSPSCRPRYITEVE